VASEVGATPAAVSIAWLLAKPQVTSVIFGARSIDQLEANLAGAELQLAGKHVEALDKASAFELGYPYEFIKNTQAMW
jgi:aryl-alcohol dehydrogenase-like predicted oxidoreductase